MKKIILTLTIVAALTGCKSNQAALNERRAAISWSAFCSARGYAHDDYTYQATNEYLDTWCGSIEEEAAFIAAGVEPY
ncbi:MAG: lipoprotein [Bacteroides sp.]|nr:lipoprotein [Bacteroides sp.]